MIMRSFTPEEQVSLLGFGTMRLPLLPGKTEIDTATASQMVDLAYQNGVNYYDTAYTYHNGQSEVFIGQALKKYPRESFFLADKMPTWLVHDLSDIERIFAHQLEKCQVSFFDSYLCHSVGKNDVDFINPYIKTGGLDYLRHLKAEGKIRHLGFSFHGNPEHLKLILSYGPWDFVQLQLNYLDWDVTQAGELYQILSDRNIPCTVMEPIRGGALATLCPKSRDILKAYAPNKSTASWALRFVASLPNVLTVLSGMSTPEQVKDNLSTFLAFTPLSGEERLVLDHAMKEYIATGAIPCTGCRYCMDCPSGVDIPRVFSVYNKCAATLSLPISFSFMHGINRNTQTFLNEYAAIPEENRASHCIGCGLCAQQCPQHIKIPQEMSRISHLTESLSK